MTGWEIVLAMLGSSGTVAIINQIFQSIRERRSAKTEDYAAIRRDMEAVQKEQKTQNRALRGILHDILIRDCTTALEAGSIHTDTLDDLRRYYYEPYTALGGDGTVEGLFSRVEALPVRRS